MSLHETPAHDALPSATALPRTDASPPLVSLDDALHLLQADPGHSLADPGLARLTPASLDRLFLAARRELSRFGFDSVVVWALADNEQACRFYRNAGGRKVARANERFGDVSLTKVAFAWARNG